MQPPVIVFPDDAWRDFARLDGYRLVHDTFLLWVINHFDMPGGWEILAERMTNKTIVGQNAAQIIAVNYITEILPSLGTPPAL